MADTHEITLEMRDRALSYATGTAHLDDNPEDTIDRARYYAEFLSGATPGYPLRKPPEIDGRPLGEVDQ